MEDKEVNKAVEDVAGKTEIEVPETSEVESVKDEVIEDRPEKNYKAELERKNREIERVRQELEAEKSRQVNRRDQNDIRTWSDLELKAIVNSKDPSVAPYVDQAQDLLLERKVVQIRERERVQEKRATTEMKLRTEYPEALDPTSEFSSKMEQVMYDFDLQKSPAGRLAAAKIVAAEMNKGKASQSGRKSESERVRDVKAQMVDGDRPKPTAVNKPKLEDVANKINSNDLDKSSNSMSELLKSKGISRNSFFK